MVAPFSLLAQKKHLLIVNQKILEWQANRNKNLLIVIYKIKSKSECLFNLLVAKMERYQQEDHIKIYLFWTICYSSKNKKKLHHNRLQKINLQYLKYWVKEGSVGSIKSSKNVQD